MQQSMMKLKLGLLHETDLLNFFRVLAEQQVGAFSVNQCSLQRITTDIQAGQSAHSARGVRSGVGHDPAACPSGGRS